MATRSIDWRQLVSLSDPDYNRMNRNVIEYEFTKPGSRINNSIDNERIDADGKRVFRGDPNTRGPYAD